jgi:anti-sigma B factor antagonist
VVESSGRLLESHRQDASVRPVSSLPGARLPLRTRRTREYGGFVDLTLSTRTQGDRTIVEVAGEIDVYTAPKLRERLVDLVTAGNYHLIVDMEGVEFLDSTGLGVLVGGLKRVRAHDGSLRLVCTQERILKIFRITGLTKVFPIHSTVEEAVEAVD